MASPSLMDVMKISGDKKMSKRVIKAAEADKKVSELTQPEEVKSRSAKEIRNKLYGKD